jgi:DNA-binding CsgD family transcriptional regulator
MYVYIGTGILNIAYSMAEDLKKITDKIAEIAAVAEYMPNVIVIHNLRGFFNSEDAKDYVPKIVGLLERNCMYERISFFQQLRTSKDRDWVWHISSIKILLRDDEQKPLLSITFAFPVDPLHHVTTKVSRLLEENNFLRRHLRDFTKLGKRECEILRLLALGKSSPETAEILHISPSTVETHRRNIKQKLNTNSFFELCEYDWAFRRIHQQSLLWKA